MGAWLCHVVCIPIPQKEPDCVDVVLVGPSDAGKTSILNRLANPNGFDGSGTPLPVMPTTGFNVENIRCRPSPDRDGEKELWVRLWDLGSVAAMEELWRAYLPICHVVLFVVDSKACATVHGAEHTKKVLERFLRNMQMKEKEDLPIYVIANKQDLLGKALRADKISSALHLSTVLKGKTWDIAEVSAKDGRGLCETIDWIIFQTRNR